MTVSRGKVDLFGPLCLVILLRLHHLLLLLWLWLLQLPAPLLVVACKSSCRRGRGSLWRSHDTVNSRFWQDKGVSPETRRVRRQEISAAPFGISKCLLKEEVISHKVDATDGETNQKSLTERNNVICVQDKIRQGPQEVEIEEGTCTSVLS